MIRVMIVEDEPPIAQSIKLLAEAYDKSIRVEHIAINGRRALEYLEHSEVDIVFSDIKMPVMDGLELARILQERYPDVMMIIVSGFSDFEFARHAIRYGVSNYLLKPVSAGHIAEVLQGATDEVKKRRELRTRSLLESAVLSDGGISTGEDSLNGVVLLYGGAYPLIPDEGILGMQDLWNVAFIEELLEQQLAGESGLCVRGRNQLELAVVFPATAPEHIREVAEGLFGQLAGNGEMPVTIAVWEQAVPLHTVADVFARLRKRIHRHIRLFRSQMLMNGGEGDNAAWSSDTQQTNLLLALKTKQLEEIHRFVEELVDSAIFQSARQRDFELCMEKIALRHFDKLLSMNELGELRYEIQSAISTSMHPSELVDELSRILYAWVAIDREQNGGDDQQLCEQMAQFLRENYRDNIRGADLARHFGYSSTQLAKKFKSRYGVSVSEFVNNFRIELAKTILQSNKKAMIKEVAIDVGYKDQYYFSKLFKKIVGVWPTEYSRTDEPPAPIAPKP